MATSQNSNRNINTAQPNVLKYKIVFLGDQSVGKTSIITRLTQDSFDGKDHPTVGIDFLSKTLYYDDKTIRLQLWDTAGQERFRSLIPSYIRDSSAAVVVYDITNPLSLQSIPKWIEFIKEERGNDVLIVLVANKIDLTERRKITQEEGEATAKDLGILFMEVSAKGGDNIANLFKKIVQTLGNQEAQNIQKNQRIIIQNPTVTNKINENNSSNKKENCNC